MGLHGVTLERLFICLKIRRRECLYQAKMGILPSGNFKRERPIYNMEITNIAEYAIDFLKSEKNQ